MKEKIIEIVGFGMEPERAELIAQQVLDLFAVSGSALPDDWKDWNTLSLDQMVEYLRNKYMFSSSGEAKCIFHLIEFYDKYK